MIANIKTIRDIAIGDTITDGRAARHGAAARLQGGEAGRVLVDLPDVDGPVRGSDQGARQARAERSRADLREGLLGGARVRVPLRLSRLLHLDVVQERLQREYDLSLLLSAPSVRYRITLEDGDVVEIDNPADFPTRRRSH